ncbi:response regulator [Lichenibacterium ramalinae]|uniref:DNA-binding response regulator n=1 Tax=Lichenibacterium ramalinae TaxID=2316527 RepID=A0A4Q2RG71_9HYPH|nr:response regulator transcription factor [Lichenibacterium ramalinae]RYB06943.1 DNA-binding response regulator [Lichenibacterium ramalinae]
MNGASLEERAAPLADDAAHLLLVDDDRRIRELLSRVLGKNGYRVTLAATAAEARAQLKSFAFDLLVLDVMMPGETGIALAADVRRTSEVPILMLTALDEADDRVRGLEAGADDYLAKPYEPRELLLRIASILRRAAPRQPKPDGVARFGPFAFHPERGELRQGDEPIRITDRERDMLAILSAAGGATVSREDLAGLAGAEGGNERAVDVQVNRLRRKIESDPANPAFLQTVRGLGYRLLLDP